MYKTYIVIKYSFILLFKNLYSEENHYIIYYSHYIHKQNSKFLQKKTYITTKLKIQTYE